MKKWIFIALALMGLVFYVAVADAAPSGPTGWYLGADAVYDGARYDGTIVRKAPNALYGVNLYAGYQLFQGISLEAGYAGRFSNASLASATTQGIFGQAVVRVPMTDSFDLLGSFGIDYMSTQVHVNDFSTLRGFAWGWRLGAGPEFTVIVPQLGWRTMVGYEQGGLGRIGSGGDVTLETGLVWYL